MSGAGTEAISVLDRKEVELGEKSIHDPRLDQTSNHFCKHFKAQFDVMDDFTLLKACPVILPKLVVH